MIDPTETPAVVAVNNADDPLDTLVRRIVEVVKPVKIVLFGSAARGSAGPGSDLDLLVVMPEGTHRRRTAKHLYRQLSGIGVPFDLIVATTGDLATHRNNLGLIYHTALSEGRTIYAA
jgi:predicted nucleotidyltransferase